MILTAKNKHAEWDIRVFNLDEVYWELDEAAKRDLKFLEAIKNSIDNKGMLWPPIVWTQKTFLKYFEDQPNRQDPMKRVNTNFIYRCAIGNSRFNYAKENGYTQIECVFVPKWQDKDTVLKITQMEYCVDF